MVAVVLQVLPQPWLAGLLLQLPGIWQGHQQVCSPPPGLESRILAPALLLLLFLQVSKDAQLAQLKEQLKSRQAA